MLMFLRIERPMTHTLRSVSIATSTACCMRWTFEAKLAKIKGKTAEVKNQAEADHILQSLESAAFNVESVVLVVVSETPPFAGTWSVG